MYMDGVSGDTTIRRTEAGDADQSPPASFLDAWENSAGAATTTLSHPTPSGAATPPGKTVLFGREPGDKNDIDPDDINQNQLGDCYLDSTMGEIALRDPDAIRSMIHDNHDGTFDVTLHRKNNGLQNLGGLFGDDFKDQKITVSSAPYPGAINTQSTDPVQVQGAHELWPQLIEQAYAQQQGGFSNIAHGGLPSEAMQSLTGHAASETPASRYSFERLQADFDNGKLVVLDTAPIGSGVTPPPGIYGSHAYMVTGVASTKQGQVVTLQNPWGLVTPSQASARFTLPYAQLHPFLTGASVGTTH